MNEELKLIIKAELSQFKKSLDDAVQSLRKVKTNTVSAEKSVDDLTDQVERQQKELRDLKKEYINVASALGEESDAAKEAADEIKKLSAEYQTNLNLARQLADKANSFDGSLSGDIDKTTNSVDGLYASMEALKGLSLAEILLEAFNLPGVQKGLDDLADSMDMFRTNMRYAFSGLFKNGSYYEETGDEWTGWADAVKGFFSSAKQAGKDFGGAMKDVGATTSAALSSIVGIIAVVIADLLVVIGLTKNALTVAKQLKQETSEASKIGLTTSAYQEWGYVLKQVGVEADKLSDFIKTLSDEQNAVRDGTEEMIQAFEAVGLTQEQVLGMDQQQLFEETVKGLQNMENAAERTSVAYRIFGEDAADLANILYLTNQETQSLMNNYYSLGAAPSDNLINKSKILTGSTTNLSYAWQGLKNTLAEWVIPAVIAVVQWLTTAVAYVNAFLQGVFGIEAASKGASAGLTSVGSGVETLQENTEKTTKSIKELLRYTAGFDELNVIPKQNTDSGSGAGAGSGAGGAGGYASSGINPGLPVIEVPDMSKFRAFMDEYGSIIQGILTWSLIGIGVVLAVLGFMSGNIGLGILGISLAGLGIAVGAAGGEESHWSKLGEGIKKVLKAIGDALKPVWEAFGKLWNSVEPMFASMGNALKELWELVKTVWSKWIVPEFKEAWAKIKLVWDLVKPYFQAVWDNIKAIFSAVVSVLTSFFRNAWEGIKAVWGMVVGYFKTVFDSIAGIFAAVRHVLSGDFKAAFDAIKGVVSSWETYFKKVGDAVKKVMKAIGSYWSDVFSSAWSSIKTIFNNFVTFVQGLWSKVSSAFKTFGTKIADTVGSAFKSVINGVLTVIESTINKPIKGINAALDVINKIPGVNITKMNLISVPRLATGGIVNSSILANIGERGAEAVLPLENNTEWMDALADRIAMRNSGPSKIVLMLDGHELGWANIRSINNITQQTGQLQLVW